HRPPRGRRGPRRRPGRQARGRGQVEEGPLVPAGGAGGGPGRRRGALVRAPERLAAVGAAGDHRHAVRDCRRAIIWTRLGIGTFAGFGRAGSCQLRLPSYGRSGREAFTGPFADSALRTASPTS